MASPEDPKLTTQIPFRVTSQTADDLEKAAAASGKKVADLLREAAAAIGRAHKRSRDGRVPLEMEIRPRYYPQPEEMSWSTAEAPPGETINAVMTQSPSVAAAALATRLRGEIVLHPHFVHLRSRRVFLDCVRSALVAEIAILTPEDSEADAGRAAAVIAQIPHDAAKAKAELAKYPRPHAKKHP